MQQLLDPTPCTLGKFLKVVGGSLSWKAFEPCALNLEEGSQPVVYISPLALASRSRLSLPPLSLSPRSLSRSPIDCSFGIASLGQASCRNPSLLSSRSYTPHSTPSPTRNSELCTLHFQPDIMNHCTLNNKPSAVNNPHKTLYSIAFLAFGV